MSRVLYMLLVQRCPLAFSRLRVLPRGWGFRAWQDCGDDQAQDPEPQIWAGDDEQQQQQFDSEEPETAQVQSLGSYLKFSLAK